MNPSESNASGSTSRPLKCAVVTPVGPGHEALYRECVESAARAVARSKGPFTDIVALKVDDGEGRHGRSRARNIGVRDAVRQGADWIFFLDADDLMVDNAFALAADYVGRYDAIWGQIYSFAQGEREAVKRSGQVEATEDINDILNNDPFLTLQMGHFVRAPLALANPFDESLDTGEDFDYYLRIWRASRCIKIPHALFANRRGLHAAGPRSATGRDWRVAVGRVMDRFAHAPRSVTPDAPMASLADRLASAAKSLLPDNVWVVDLAPEAGALRARLNGTHTYLTVEQWTAHPPEPASARPVWLAALANLEQVADLRAYLREAAGQKLGAVVAYRPASQGTASGALDRAGLTAAIHQAGYDVTAGERVDDVLVLRLAARATRPLQEAAA
jgi:hypothetical protein